MRTGGKRCASDAVSSEVTTDQTSGISIISDSGMRKKCHGLNGQRRGRRSGTASRSSGRPAPISVPLSITPPSRLAVDAPGADLELDDRDEEDRQEEHVGDRRTVTGVEELERADRRPDDQEERGGPQERQHHIAERAPLAGPVDLRRLHELLWDALK